MLLWKTWYSIVRQFQVCCSRNRTFALLVLVLAGFSIRWESSGITSFIRAIALEPSCYRSFLHFFNYSHALDLERITCTWVQCILKFFMLYRINNRIILIVDGLKIPKEGRKMPAVKSLHQESQNNSKPPYIMGHMTQSVSVLATNESGHIAAIPLTTRIHEGVRETPRDQRTLLDRMIELLCEVLTPFSSSALILADAYYASAKMIRPLLESGHHLITRVRQNAVAYQTPQPPRQTRRGRPRKYGKKVHLNHLFTDEVLFQTAQSPLVGEAKVKIEYHHEQLIWKPVGIPVLFVWVKHPHKGKMILMTTDVDLDPLQVIQLYSYRFKIEIGFRDAVHTIGTYAYHFWLKRMKPTKRGDGEKYLHRELQPYREMIQNKMEAYHRHIQCGVIAQGLLQYLSLYHSEEVWKHFRVWFRTINKSVPPSVLVVSYAMRNGLLEFIQGSDPEDELRKILFDKMALEQVQEYQLAI